MKKALTQIELIVIVAVLSSVALIAVPRLQFGAIHRKQADVIARRIIADLRRTRTLAISNAANNSAGYALKMTGASPYTGYKILDLSTATMIQNGLFPIDSAVNCTGTNLFKFGPMGNLLTAGNNTLSVSSNGKIFTITIISNTGMVKCSEN